MSVFSAEAVAGARYVGPDAEEVETMLQLVGARIVGPSRPSGTDTVIVYIPGYRVEIDTCPIGIAQWTSLIQRMMKPGRKV